jgi:hypothetical protein
LTGRSPFAPSDAPQASYYFVNRNFSNEEEDVLREPEYSMRSDA